MVGRTSAKGGRPGKEYLLSHTGAVKVAAKSEGPRAIAILNEVVRVWDLAVKGAPISPAPTAPMAEMPPVLLAMLQQLADGQNNICGVLGVMAEGQRAHLAILERLLPATSASDINRRHNGAVGHVSSRKGRPQGDPAAGLRFQASLKAIRLGMKWSQDQLARRVGLPVDRVRALEHKGSVPHASRLLQISERLGLTVDELLSGDPPIEKVRAACAPN